MTDRTTSERVTVRVPAGLLEQIDDRVERGEFSSRSEAVRSALRRIAIEDSHIGTR